MNHDENQNARTRLAEVFMVFLGLGLTSFGGPVAHLGYFREALVVRRGWLSEEAYADIVALCQFLPGPASSQVGMSIGLKRAGYLGMLAAWVGFTLPSAIALVAFAYTVIATGAGEEAGWILGLKAAAVAVVAHAVLGMARSLTPDRERATIGVGAMVVALLVPNAFGQIVAIALGGLVGLAMLRPDPVEAKDDGELAPPISHHVAIGALVIFAGLLVLLPLMADWNPALDLFDRFYRAGALVFGGGHVVLPLLEAELVQTGLVDREMFLAGYGAAQAVPGPLFTFAAYLGAVTNSGTGGLAGATLALIAIFLPSALLVIGGLTYWGRLRANPVARRALMGVNAAVVGLLSAALYDPVFVEGIRSPMAMVIAALAFVALNNWKCPAWIVVVLSGVVGQFVL